MTGDLQSRVAFCMGILEFKRDVSAHAFLKRGFIIRIKAFPKFAMRYGPKRCLIVKYLKRFGSQYRICGYKNLEVNLKRPFSPDISGYEEGRLYVFFCLDSKNKGVSTNYQATVFPKKIR